jgi:hypothetical protein
VISGRSPIIGEACRKGAGAFQRGATSDNAWVSLLHAFESVPFADHMPVLSFGPRMVCSRRGIVRAGAQPNWKERPEHETLIGVQWR